MKILMLTASLDRGGAETHVCALARGLVARGHAVTVASAGGRLVEMLTENGVDHVRIDWSRSPLGLLRGRGALVSLLDAKNFDLIHAHSRIACFVATGVARRKSIPLVTTAHARFRVGPVLRRLSRWGDRTVAVGTDLKTYLEREYGVSSERITVIANGIDTVRFSPARGARFPHPPRLLFLSRLDRDCSLGALLLCELAPLLAEQFPQWEILIGGGGDCLSVLKERVERLRREHACASVRLLGHVEDPAACLSGVDAFLGVSRCALEAMACGVPTVLGGDEGFLGIGVPSRLPLAEQSNFCCRGAPAMTAKTLWEALKDLLSRSEAERRALGQAQCAYVRERCGIEGMVKKTEAVYEGAVAKKKDVLLCGYYGFGNAGDDALLAAAAARARERFPSQTVCALTRRGRRDESVLGLPCVCRTSPFAVWRAMGRSSCLILGGGTLLQDTTSRRSLLYYVLMLRVAQLRGLRTELWGNGLGMPQRAGSEALMRHALVGCDAIGLRDAYSMELARGLLGRNCVIPLYRESDLALGQAACDGRTLERLLVRLGIEDQSNFVVVAPRGGAGRGIVRLLIRELTVLCGRGIVPVVAVLYPDEDRGLGRRLCQTVGGILAEGLTPCELVGLMSRSRGVYGMRLHALIFAASAGVPFVGFGGDPKIEAFCREQGGRYFTDL